MDEIRVLAPATVSNVVCGFDCLGFSLAKPYDEIVVRRTSKPGIAIIHLDDFGLPTDPKMNVAGVALQALLDAAQPEHGFEIEMTKHIKPGSGIGSSSASSCGAVVAANALLGDRFSKIELLDFAMHGEFLASGSRHADNAAPCIFGGFTLVRSIDPIDVVTIDFPPLYVTVVHPQIEIKTSEARAVLPKEVPLRDAVRNWSNLGAFVAALSKGDLALLSRSMEDLIIEPARKSLIPKFDEVKAASLAAGAIGGGISGSGPSVFMIAQAESTAKEIEFEMSRIYGSTEIQFKTYVGKIDARGVRSA